MRVDLDQKPLTGPNPPPWKIDYVNEGSSNGILPEAHTHGIHKFNRYELLLRKAPPNIAASVLDRIGLWLLDSSSMMSVGDIFLVLGTTYKVVHFVDSEQQQVFRLAWENDPT